MIKPQKCFLFVFIYFIFIICFKFSGLAYLSGARNHALVKRISKNKNSSLVERTQDTHGYHAILTGRIGSNFIHIASLENL